MTARPAFHFPHRHLLGIEGLGPDEITGLIDLSESYVEQNRRRTQLRGIYLVSTLGGEPRLIVKNGYLPRISPDGSRIAYSQGPFGQFGFGVYTFATGSTQIMAPDLLSDGRAVWSPDGKSLVFAAAKDYVQPYYLWTCAVDGGPSTRMSAYPITEEIFRWAELPYIAWFGDQIIVSKKQADNSNLWAASITRGSRKVSGELKRITLGSGNEVVPSLSAGGKLAFVNHSYSTDIWEASLDKAGKTGGSRT